GINKQAATNMTASLCDMAFFLIPPPYANGSHMELVPALKGSTIRHEAEPTSTGTRASRRRSRGQSQSRRGRAQSCRRSPEDCFHLERAPGRRSGSVVLPDDRSSDRCRPSVAFFLLSRVRAMGLGRSAHARPAPGRINLEPHPIGALPAVHAQRAVCGGEGADGRTAGVISFCPCVSGGVVATGGCQ